MTTGYTQADLDKVRAGILHGVKEISVGGRRKVFQDVKDMIALEALIVASIAADQPVQHGGVNRRRSVMIVDC